MRTATQIFAIAALLDQTNGWWGNGHLLTSRVAFEILQKDSPDTVTQVENILKVLKVSDPSWTKSEDTHPMIECVTFADDIKHKGGAYQSGWHFIDTPFLDEGGDISDYDFTFDAHNVTEAITAIGSWINKDDGYTNTFEYEQIQKNGMKGHSEADGLSTAMRLILHYVGDIHQPLHATSRVNHEFPQGDRGGNSVPLPSVDGAKNLHSVWDSVVYSQTSDYNLPFSSKDWDTISADAKRLMDTYPIEESVATNLDVNQWAQDSFEISSSFLYEGVTPNQTLTDEYIQKGKELAEKQVVIGGNRLATLLKSLNLEQWQEECAAAVEPSLVTKITTYLGL